MMSSPFMPLLGGPSGRRDPSEVARGRRLPHIATKSRSGPQACPPFCRNFVQPPWPRDASLPAGRPNRRITMPPTICVSAATAASACTSLPAPVRLSLSAARTTPAANRRSPRNSAATPSIRLPHLIVSAARCARAPRSADRSFTIPVYDGARRFDILGHILPKKDASEGTIRAELTLRPIAGFKGETSEDGDPDNAPRKVDLWSPTTIG